MSNSAGHVFHAASIIAIKEHKKVKDSRRLAEKEMEVLEELGGILLGEAVEEQWKKEKGAEEAGGMMPPPRTPARSGNKGKNKEGNANASGD